MLVIWMKFCFIVLRKKVQQCGGWGKEHLDQTRNCFLECLETSYCTLWQFKAICMTL